MRRVRGVIPAAEVAETPWELPAAAVLAVFVVLSLWLTFRHLSKFGSAIPGTPGDSLLNLWIVTHVQDSVLHGWHALWNAPIFAPVPHTLAYSESLFVVALVDWPLRLIFGPIAAYNTVHVAATVLAAGALPAGHALHARLERRVVGAVWCTRYSAARVTDFGHFQIVVGGALVPLVLLALVRCLDVAVALRGALPRPRPGGHGADRELRRRARRRCSSRSSLIGWLLWRRPPRGGVTRLAGVVVAAVVGVLAGPFVYEYVHLQHQSGFQRAFVPGMALHLNDFVRLRRGAWRRTSRSSVPVSGRRAPAIRCFPASSASRARSSVSSSCSAGRVTSSGAAGASCCSLVSRARCSCSSHSATTPWFTVTT